MWHVLHLIARPIEALLGVFCVLTAIVLYPDEDGKIQSKLEDFWVRVDDYQHLALSKHAAFMVQVARLETAILTKVFGEADLGKRPPIIATFLSALSFLLAVFAVRHYRLQKINDNLNYIAHSSVVSGFSMGIAATYATALATTTRKITRLAGEMNSVPQITAVIALNLLLACCTLAPPILSNYNFPSKPNMLWSFILVVSTTGFFVVGLASLFAGLALLLLVHHLLWPLLTRTLFRMADIGTKGRRAILTTVGLALLAAGVSGKVPDLVQKLIEKFGG